MALSEILPAGDAADDVNGDVAGSSADQVAAGPAGVAVAVVHLDAGALAVTLAAPR